MLYAPAHRRLYTSTFERVASWDALSPSPDLPVDRVVSLYYFSDTLTTCVILAGGDIVLVQEEDGGGGGDAHVEIVGSIDALTPPQARRGQRRCGVRGG